jgi:hypothetical protein
MLMSLLKEGWALATLAGIHELTRGLVENSHGRAPDRK